MLSGPNVINHYPILAILTILVCLEIVLLLNHCIFVLTSNINTNFVNQTMQCFVYNTIAPFFTISYIFTFLDFIGITPLASFTNFEWVWCTIQHDLFEALWGIFAVTTYLFFVVFWW